MKSEISDFGTAMTNVCCGFNYSGSGTAPKQFSFCRRFYGIFLFTVCTVPVSPVFSFLVEPNLRILWLYMYFNTPDVSKSGIGECHENWLIIQSVFVS